MIFTAEVRIELKAGVVDAEGETVKKSLNLLGYPVENVATVKIYKVRIDADAIEKLNSAAGRLLANQVIQTYSIEIKNA